MGSFANQQSRRRRRTRRRKQPRSFNSIRSRLGKKIRRLREKKRLTRAQFAQACGLRSQYLGRIERGDHDIHLANLVNVARALGMTVAELVRGVW